MKKTVRKPRNENRSKVCYNVDYNGIIRETRKTGYGKTQTTWMSLETVNKKIRRLA